MAEDVLGRSEPEDAPGVPDEKLAVSDLLPPGRFRFLDILVFSYTGWVALLVALFRHRIPEWRSILAFHLLVLALIPLLPPRGARWEEPSPGGPPWKRHLRGGLRFFRYSYPLLLILFFFEEVQHTVNALWPHAPYWFEPYLYAWDRSLFGGELPAVLLDPATGLVQDELMHGFYFSYYFILVGGVAMAWFSTGPPRPGPGFQRTLASAITAFFLCFVWYPFLPARGPWENPELMARLSSFEGFLFVPVIEAIIEQGAVSGGCFPSSHVAASWGIVFGLARFHRKNALWLGFLALGMSFSCVYTRYHHAVDVPAGFACGLLGAWIASRWE